MRCTMTAADVSQGKSCSLVKVHDTSSATFLGLKPSSCILALQQLSTMWADFLLCILILLFELAGTASQRLATAAVYIFKESSRGA